ncbi:sigma-70 family RNA polymerase sigma factor [Neorhodopirellula pilleata]|uniref:RNA polymerase sigma factor n=1 Tax=Neorhodopirellula pilleata TaxID=2714738 RepID=A0A5C6AVQ0_9BACT|nr:sigma-70 family RNA polymerase sigma factor [Neorhodopirellula pilleata]TWU03136.1 RNA polymerase sigma factor [Neorhodopirellula pilleata]
MGTPTTNDDGPLDNGASEDDQCDDDGGDGRRIAEERSVCLLADYLKNHERRLAGFIRSLCGPRLLAVTEVDDLLQEVATSAVSGLATAPLDQYTVWQWLQQLARRRVVDAHRHHFEAKRRDAGREVSFQAGGEDTGRDGLQAMLAASITSPSAVLSRDVRLSRLRQTLDSMPEEQRTVVTMRYLEGKTSKQIAEKTGKSDAAVRVMLSRSTKWLEDALSDVKPSTSRRRPV